MEKTLFIGRFQPFHNGHLSVVESEIEKGNFVIIGVGSAETHHTKENPYTFRERWQMISSALQEKKLPPTHYIILPLRDIHNEKNWVQHVKNLTPPFNTVITGSPIVKQLFEADGQVPVNPVQFIHTISGTQIRKKLNANDPSWEKDVPRAVTQHIKNF